LTDNLTLNYITPTACAGQRIKESKMNNKAKYYDLQEKLAKLEKEHNVYLADPCVDLENVDFKAANEFTNEQYGRLYSVACSAAGGRAEEAGLDLNKLIGKIIY
jgi:hypothetical protein